MAVGIDDVLEAAAVPAIVVGVGAVVAAPFLAGGGRNVAKKLMRGYLDVSHKVKEMTAETRERWADLKAEVEAERAAQATQRAQGNGQSHLENAPEQAPA